MIEGLVLADFVLSITSDPVRVALPTVRRVTLNVRVPDENVALAGNVAFTSEDVSPARSVTELTTFQLASTAFSVTLKAAPAVCAPGVPFFPAAVPGAAVSPGTNNCMLANAPAVTVMDGLVFVVFVASVTSAAVTVRVPAVFAVRTKLAVPETRAAFAGNVALVSEQVILIVSDALVTGFQFASTALTVTLNGVPAV